MCSLQLSSSFFHVFRLTSPMPCARSAAAWVSYSLRKKPWAPLGRLFCLSSVLTMQYSLAREIGLALAPSPGEFGARRHGVAVRAVCGVCRAAA